MWKIPGSEAVRAVGIYICGIQHSTQIRRLLEHHHSFDMSTNGTRNLEQGNRAYVAEFTQGNLALPPSQKYTVLTCMDARIDPAAAFGTFTL